MLSLVALAVLVGWISPGMREHEDEFRQAWARRYGMTPNSTGQTGPPASTYKAWYKQWKKTGIGPDEWLAALAQGPPGSALI
jgi:hypothetical protein